MIPIEKLKKYAENLEFTMKEEEYITLQEEFEVLLKQVDLISKIDGLSNYEPMNFPFPLESAYLRSDEYISSINVNDAFKNCKSVENDSVKVPKVVNNE